MSGRHARPRMAEAPAASNKHRKPKVKRNLIILSSFALSAAATSLISSANQNSSSVQAFGDMAESTWRHTVGNPSATEAKIEHATDAAFGDTPWVQCTPLNGNRDGNRIGQFMRLVPSTCRAIEGLVANPDNSQTAEEYNQRSIALGHIAHEVSHKDTRNEGIAQCYAVQRTAALAVTFGADPKIAASYARTYADVSIEHPPGKEYEIPKECKPGGLYDLHIEGAVYPTFPGDLEEWEIN